MPLVRKDASAPPAPKPDVRQWSILLESGSLDERWKAARDATSVPDSLPLLERALASEESARVREAICTSLARMATLESAKALLPYLRSEHASRRTEALDALRAMPHAVGPLLPELLSDPDSDVRLLSCEIVRTQPSEQISRLLGRLLEQENEANVCSAAIEVLAEAGSKSDLPVLIGCAARFPEDPFLAFAVETASKRIGSR